MPILTDTHVHFDSSAAATLACVKRALEAGVTRLMAVGGSAELNAAAIVAARAFPAHVRLALGLDRDQAGKTEVGSQRSEVGGRKSEDADEGKPNGILQHPTSNEEPSTTSQEPSTLRRCAAARDCAAYPPYAIHLPHDLSLSAIGEIGLDYHYHPDTKAAQCELFAGMLRLAAARDLPAIIHTRDADDDTLRIMDEAGSQARRAAGALGVVHCYTGGPDFARALLDRGLYLSFSGIVTFRNADMLRGVARLVPADRLLIETDSPFLAPVPRRGQRNEPAFVVHVAELLANLRGVPLDELAALTSQNAGQLFGAWQV